MESEILSELLTEEEIRRRMSEISARFPGERQAQKDAYKALARREAEAQLGIVFCELSIFHNPKVIGYLVKAKNENIKLTVADKEALLNLELEDLKAAHDLAKFDCETSDKDYTKLQGLLSWYQSVMKNQ